MELAVAYSCGQTTYQNNSLFSNPSYPSSYDGTGSCQLTVNKERSDVCQLRYHFKYKYFVKKIK